jgi:hypothetical protein
MTFEYPGIWHQQSFDVPASMASSITYLSTEELHDPCDRTGAAVTCEWPVDQLAEDGVVLVWTRFETPSPPGLPPAPDPSVPVVQIGGRDATLTEGDATVTCAAIGGQQEIHADIPIPDDPSNSFVMDACVRGPNFELTSAAIAGMLASVEWKS